MNKNPARLRVTTPERDYVVENVVTWWRKGPDLIVELLDGREVGFPCGEIID